MLLAAALACACFAGCGGKKGEASPVDVVRKFVESLVEGDSERA